MGRVVALRRSVASWVVIAGLLLGAGVLVVSVGGPVDFLSTPQPTSQVGPVAPAATPTFAQRTPRTTSPWDDAMTPSAVPSWVDTLRQCVVLLTVMAAAYSLWRFGRYLAQLIAQRGRHAKIPQSVAVTPLPEVPELLVGASATERRRTLLGEGEPRNAIVATWLDLEESLVASGVPPRPAETPAEYVSRVLTTWDVDVRALADLAELYREARFSSHAMDEQQRDRALRDLDRVHADIAAAQGARL